MNWIFKDPKPADMVRVKLGDIYHYGIFVAEDEIIQFGQAPNARIGVPDSEIKVCSTDLTVFLSGGSLEVAELDEDELKKRREEKATVEYARQKIGESGYNILYNNCEHFAYECVMGSKYSSQVDDIRAKFRYLAKGEG